MSEAPNSPSAGAKPRTVRQIRKELRRELRVAGVTEATIRRELPGLLKEALHDEAIEEEAL